MELAVRDRVKHKFTNDLGTVVEVDAEYSGVVVEWDDNVRDWHPTDMLVRVGEKDAKVE